MPDFFGGETDAEKKIREERERAIAEAYGTLSGQIKSQYYGPLQGDIEEISKLRTLLATGADMGITLTPQERRDIELRVEQMERDLNQKLEYQPDVFVPTTDYDVYGYDVGGYEPVKAKAISGVGAAHLGEALYPDKYGRPDYEKFGVPEFEAAATQSPSEAAKARADAQGLAAQRAALASIEDIYNQGGLTAIDRARLEEIRRRNQMKERASREAIMADLERRGISGSGVELASRLANQQGSAERQAQEALGVEALAEQRALDAMKTAGIMGRELAGDVYFREHETGADVDEINKFNTIGYREVQADTRAAQTQFIDWVRQNEDIYREWQRALLENDVKTLQDIENKWAEDQTKANLYLTESENLRNKYLADQRNEESRYGVTATNAAKAANAITQNEANRIRSQNAWNQLVGVNTQKQNIGNVAVGEQGAWDVLQGQIPTVDVGSAVRSGIELGKTAYEFFTDPGSDREKVTGSSSGGEGGDDKSALSWLAFL